MKQITLICVGTLKERYLSEAAAEYKKRLQTLSRLEEITLPEERIPDEGNEAHIRAALHAEGERILRAIPKGAITVALCVEGKSLDSVHLSRLLDERTADGGRLCMIIGSSHGLSPAVKAAADLRLSVSPMTFPHQLMRVIAYEMLYRTRTIQLGKAYHK